MEKYDYEKLQKLGYGEHLITDEKGEIIATSCNHYYNIHGECIYCGEIKYKSPLWYKLYGGEYE